MKRDKIIAIVPVRKGSQRVKNKNFKPFADTNLLAAKLDILTKVDILDEIVVSTDSETAIEIANSYGVSIHKREPYYASSICNNSEFFQNLAENVDCKYVIYSPCTAPLVSIETYYDFINRFMNAKDSHDSMATVSYVKHHMWLDEKPINYDPANSPNTQDLPNIVKLTYGISIISKDDMIKYKNIIGKQPIFYTLDEIESIDVDTALDFEIAEFLFKRHRL